MDDTQQRSDEPATPGFTMHNGYGSENTAIDHAFRIIEEAGPPRARRNGRIIVCGAHELKPGEKRIVEGEGVSIGVFNIGGAFYALKNVCPHLGAPLCRGTLHATHRPGDVFEFQPDLAGRILRCPWHGWEFDVVTGKGLYDKNSRVATYLCEVDENNDVVVHV